MYKKMALIFLTIVTASLFAAPKKENKPFCTLFSTLPIDNSSQKEKNKWAVSFFDTYIRFRLEPLKEISVIPRDTLCNYLPELKRFSNCTDSAMFSYAKKTGCKYIIVPLFEITKNKSISFYVDIISAQSRSSVASVEKDIPIDQIPQYLDTLLLMTLSSIHCELSPSSTRFFQISIANPNLKSIKQYGEFVYNQTLTVNQPNSKLISEYEKCFQKDPMLLLAYYPYAKTCMNDGQYEKAAKYLKELLDLSPVHTLLFTMLSESYRMSGRTNDAFLIVSKFDQTGPSSIPFLYEKAKVFEVLKQSMNAYKVYYQILTLNSKHKEALLYCSRFNNNDSKFSAALPFSEMLIKVDSTDGNGYFERARSQMGLGKSEIAMTLLKKASHLLPNDAAVAEYYADALTKMNNYADAISLYKKALSLNQHNFNLLIKSSKAFRVMGNNSAALDILKSNAAFFPAEPLLKKYIGLQEYENKNYQASIDQLVPFAKVDTGDIEVLVTLGNAYEKSGQYDLALTSLLKALPLADNKIDCSLSIARIYLSKKDALAAQKVIKPILSQCQVKGAYCLMGDALLMSGNVKDALYHYNKERDLHGNDRVVQEKIAKLQYASGSYTQASLEFKKLLQINADHPDARYYIAIIMLKDGNVTGAVSMLKDALAYGKGSPETITTLANELFKKNIFDKAAEFYEKAIALVPADEETLLKCAQAESKAGNDSTSAERYMQLFTKNNGKYSYCLAEAGHLFQKRNLNANAAAAYLLFLSRGFSDINVNIGYAEIEYENRNYSSVCSVLKNMSAPSEKVDKKVLLMLADSRCQTGDFNGAIPLLNYLLKDNSENKLILRLSGLAFEKTNDILKSITMYEQYLKLPKDTEYASTAFHLGQLYETAKMIDNAISRYEQNRKLFIDDFRNHERLGNLYISKSLWKQAQDVLEIAVAYPESKPVLKKMLAQTYANKGAIDKAISLYRSYLEKINTDIDAWKELGKIYSSRQNFSDAITAFSMALQNKSDDFESNMLLGKAYVESGNYKKAISPLGHAKTQKPSDLTIMDLYARCYRNLNETSSLASILKEWIALDPKRYDIKLELGSIYLSENEIDVAITILNDASTFLPTEYRPHLLLAEAYELKGNDSLRLSQLNKALKCGPENWELDFQYARYYLSKKNSVQAEDFLHKVLKQKPDHAQSHYELAQILNEKQNFSQALSELQYAIKIDSSNPQYYSLIAYIYTLNNMSTNALVAIDTALSLGSKDPVTYYWIGQTYRLNNNKNLALTNIQKALQLDPNFANGYEALGDLLMDNFKFKEASRNYFSSWEKGGYNATRALKLGNALAYNLQYNEAKGFYESILNHNESCGEAVYRTIYVYCKLGDLKNARNFQKYFRKDDAPWLQLAQGILYETDKNSESALTAYTIASKIAPQNPLAYSGFGRIYAQRNQPDSSIANFKRSLQDSLNIQNYIDLATVYQETGKNDSALLYFKVVDSRYPEHPWVQIYIASIESQLDDHKAAVAILQRGITYHPADPMLHFLLGQELEFSGTFEDAINEYQLSLKIGKGQPVEALRNIGTIYFQKLINDKKAKEFYKKYVKAGGNKNDIADAMKKLEGI